MSSKKRSKSVSGRSQRHEEKGRSYDLKHSVSIEDKRKLANMKKKKTLVDEYIVLDAAKHMLECKINDLKHNLDKVDLEKTGLSNDLENMKVENHKLVRDLEKEEELKHVEMEKIKCMLECNIKDLQHTLEKVDSEKNGLSNDLEKMNVVNRKLERDLEIEKKTRREEEMKQRKAFEDEMEKIKEDNRKKNEELTKERVETWKYVQQISEVLESRQAKVFISGACKNIQIGESNIIKHKVMSQFQELTSKLLLSMDDFMMKRQELEMEVRSTKAELKEMQDSINRLVKSLQMTKIKKYDRELLVFMTADRSDEFIFTEGIKQLKSFSAAYKRENTLPLYIDAMVERLLNKLEGITCGDFVAMLEGKNQSLSKEMASDDIDQTEEKQLVTEKDSAPLQEFYNDSPLERCHCVEVLSKWIHKSGENDHEKFIGKIKAYESKQAAELITQYQEEIKAKNDAGQKEGTKGSGQHVGSATESSILPIEQSQRDLPDALSQFMHLLEGLQIVLHIDRKVDKILKATTGSKECP